MLNHFLPEITDNAAYAGNSGRDSHSVRMEHLLRRIQRKNGMACIFVCACPLFL
jgi:hypothetical protein